MFTSYHLSFTVDDKGLIAGGREKKGGREMVFFTPLNPSGEDSDEETQDESLTVLRKVHYRSVWQDKQDAVYWVTLAHA